MGALPAGLSVFSLCSIGLSRFRRFRAFAQKKRHFPSTTVMKLNRRQMIQSSLAAGAAISAVPILGAESGRKYRTVLIGSGWWGRNILRCAMEAGESRVVGLCDVDENQLDGA